MLPSLADDLRRAGVGDVRFDPASRILYSTDASIYQVEPVGVVIPRTQEEIPATVAVCRQHGVPVLPRGAGTSLAGQTIGSAVIVDTSKHLNRIVRVNPEERWVRCQPGVVLDHLNAALRPHGLMLGPDPASDSRATVGGTVGNNGTGAHSILYGMIADNVLACAAVLADGAVVTFDDTFFECPPAQAGHLPAELRRILHDYAGDIRRDFPRHWRRASGYNLDKLLVADRPNPAQLIAGSEGTLAFMTEVTLKLVPRPVRTVLGIVHFDDLVAAAEATPPLLELHPSAVELMDKVLLDLCRVQPEYARRLTFVEGDPACVLAVEFYVESEDEGKARLGDLRKQLGARGFHGVVVPLLDPAAQANAWSVRKAGLSLLLSQRGDVKPAGFMEDVAVPAEHLAGYVRGVQKMFAEHGKQAAFYAHASAGCLHIRPLLNLKTAADIAVMDAMQSQLLALIRPLGGVLSGEHGDGLKLTHLNRLLFGERVTQAFAEVKLAFDPQVLFNPGKKVPGELLERVKASRWQEAGVPTMSAGALNRVAPDHTTDPAQLRYGPAYRTIDLMPVFDWWADGGFARAVEMCNGSGDCRKATGVMCPSFQATHEEEHSTRGRANLLRAALSGQLGSEAWTDPAVAEALDLCLGCKACKTECPSSVDMAKIKSEVLAQRYARQGVPVRARLFGHIHTLNRLAAPVAPMANAALRIAPVRSLVQRLTGLHPARALPPIAQPSFHAWFARRAAPPESIAGSRGCVALFADTFITYNYPKIGIAAVRVLESAGYEVRLAERMCCGRPMLSQGLVEDARRNAIKNVDRLAPLAEQGLPILVCEPSCASAFREEYAELLPGNARLAALMKQVYLIDDWLAEQLTSGLELPVRSVSQQVLFHGHCHQKAGAGTAGSLAVLRAVPGQQVSLIDAGCCGMAGAFGYTADHYAISEAIARDRLVPAIEAAPDALISADGASCRQQIEHFTGRPAWHVVEVLAQALTSR
jgi:FAD/FMN-containing dehydrogenase/Fe-S oxidoreductase